MHTQLLLKFDGVNGAVEFLMAVGFQQTSTHFVLPDTVSVRFCNSLQLGSLVRLQIEVLKKACKCWYCFEL